MTLDDQPAACSNLIGFHYISVPLRTRLGLRWRAEILLLKRKFEHKLINICNQTFMISVIILLTVAVVVFRQDLVFFISGCWVEFLIPF